MTGAILGSIQLYYQPKSDYREAAHFVTARETLRNTFKAQRFYRLTCFETKIVLCRYDG
jgi:hypothetical protein